MNSSFEYITTLEYRLKAAANEIAAFKSGEKYIQMEQHCRGAVRRLESRIRALESELAKAHAETVTVRNYWFDVAGDVEHENKRNSVKLKKQSKTWKSVH